MKKSYNISSKSDMRRFKRDLEQQFKNNARQAVFKRKYIVTCPHCKNRVPVYPGKSHCPLCSQMINLKLNVHF